MPTKLPLEVAVFSSAAAHIAQTLGAHRIELNAPGSYASGGLTPPVSELLSIAGGLKIPVRIMVRPAGSPLGIETDDFMYDHYQYDAMKGAMDAFKISGVMNPCRGDGFVFGILKPATPEDKAKDPDARVSIDVKRCTELVQYASPFPCVFHRAFDPIACTKAWQNGVDDIKACGFEGILTSGGPGGHADHLKRLDEIAIRVKGKLELIVGGGLRSSNAKAPVGMLGIYPNKTVWLHSACLTPIPGQDRPAEHINRDELADLMAAMELAQVE